MTTAVHAVTDEERRCVELRAQALQRFTARYRHNVKSQRAMVGGLRRLATTFSEGVLDERTFPWELLVTEQLTQDFWETVAAGYARATARRDASALRIMLENCYRVGLLTYEQYRHAASFEAEGGQSRAPAGTYLSLSDLTKIVRTTERGPGHRTTKIRDIALLMTMAGSGPRREEVAHIRAEHVELSDRRILLTTTKGGLPREAYLHPSAVTAIGRWMEARGGQPGPLFVPLSRTGRPMHEHGHLSEHQIWKIIRRRSAAAGFAGIAPHDLRRFLISQLLETTDVVLVAAIVGHRNPQTTATYDRRPQARRREAVATVRLPGPHRIEPDLPPHAG